MCVEEIDIDAADLCNEKTKLELDQRAATPKLKCVNISFASRQVFVLPVTCQGQDKIYSWDKFKMTPCTLIHPTL